jgi:N-hydroxyarylamine O-acetyltransferase
VEPLSRAQRDAYLDRIGLPGHTDASVAELQWAHLQRVPFENLSIHLDEPIELDTAALFDKIVSRRRGGFCYELNGLFGRLLESLGHDVEMLSAGVYGPRGVGPPFDHMVLRVGEVLVDAGFGRHSARPLRLDLDTDQADLLGTFRITPADGGDLDVLRDGEPQYRVELRPRRMQDYVPTCWWQQSSPTSHFRQGPVCSLQTADGGQVTLAGRTLIETPLRGDRVETELTSDAEVLTAYRDHFGIVLDRVPEAPRRNLATTGTAEPQHVAPS